MKQRSVVAIAVIVSIATGVISVAMPASVDPPMCTTKDVLCYQPFAQKFIDEINTVKEPPIAIPAWLE